MKKIIGKKWFIWNPNSVTGENITIPRVLKTLKGIINVTMYAVLLKPYSPGWSAQYSGSDPSGRRRKCRKGQSCSEPAAEIRDQTFRQSDLSCLLSAVARHAVLSAKWSDWRSCWHCFSAIYSHTGLTWMTTDTFTEMRGWKYKNTSQAQVG